MLNILSLRGVRAFTAMAMLVISHHVMAADSQPAVTPAADSPVQGFMPPVPEVAAKSYVLMEASTGQILATSNPHQRLPPASLTKLMTAYIAESEMDHGRLKPTDLVNISVNAWKTGGSRMFVREGTQVSVMDLMRGIVIQSGNDATVAMAEHIAGSEDAFADLMNQMAQRLGMKDTHFMNPTGLPHPDHYSSAFDMAILARDIIENYPDHYALYSEKEFTYNNIRQPNRNLLLDRDPSVDGLKTGHTDEAGYCLVASAKRDNTRLIGVEFGTDSIQARAQEMQKLLSYGFRYYETQHLYKAAQPLESLRIWGGDVDQVSVGTEKALDVVIPRGQAGNLKASLELNHALEAPIAQGEQMGTVQIKLGDNVIREVPLVALNPINEGGFFKRLSDSVVRRVQGWF
ncbi:D-alanyl-D-alanine carboxypeptidase family protein [Pokkaliibacter sp. CJK22405]|uniref:D-alanyl-D-alanine carboxypeptidase family protein n=1 Tax=Pokkaliibacter sp. CJK22405 TaxID=3384615 RepID=UPI0039852493